MGLTIAAHFAEITWSWGFSGQSLACRFLQDLRGKMNRTVADCLWEMCWYLGVFSSSLSPVPVQWVWWRLRVFIWLMVSWSHMSALWKSQCQDQAWVFWARKELIIIKTVWISQPAPQTVLVGSNHTSYCCASRNAFQFEMMFTIPTACAFSLFQAQGPSLKLVRSSEWKILFRV